jgi:MSHA pilin protein MshC
MRLRTEKIELNKSEAECHFGSGAESWLASKRAKIQYGFTLVELITIIVILGIISAVALPRFTGHDAFRDRATADQVAAALRYAQKVAIASHSNVTVRVSAGANSNCGTAVVGGVVACVIPNGVAIDRGLPWDTTFDFMGRPVPNVATAATVGTTIITIAAETGYVR